MVSDKLLSLTRKINPVMLFICIQAIVLTNTILHDYSIGYDASGHRKNAEILSTLRLPSPADSREYFSPPLPYLFTAFIVRAEVSIANRLGMDVEHGKIWLVAGKLSQFMNFILSLGIVMLLLRICELLKPGDSNYKISSLILLGILPVYYKTLSQMRPEPYVIFFFILALWMSLKIFVGFQTTRWFIGLGVVLGLLVLSRQWGFFIFPPIMAMFLAKMIHERSGHVLKAGTICMLCALIVGGWFYVYLLFSHESIIAFNLPPGRSSIFTNHPLEFYFSSGMNYLFSNPIRPNFSYPAKLFPILYSETWGDYWGFFTLDMAKPAEASFLAYMNMAGILPSLLMAGGFGWGVLALLDWVCEWLNPKSDSAKFGFLALTALSCIGGYLWFLMKYPDAGKGATIKATYIIHLYPVLALLGAGLMDKIHSRFGERVWLTINLALIICWGCLLPAMFSRWHNL